jgi:hypothetical protein
MSRATRACGLLLSACVVLASCVSVSDDKREPRVPEGGGGGTGGGSGGSGGGRTGGMGGNTGGSGGSGGNTGGGMGGMGGHMEPRPPKPDVDAIFESGCATSTTEAELPQVNLLFVLDRSASMLCNPPPLTSSEDCEMLLTRADAEMPSKWEITRNALSEAIRALPPKTVVGISYFSNDDGCGVHSRPRVPLAVLADSQISAIEASLGTVTPSGSTPLVGATILAYRHLHEAALAGRVRGESFVVLLTDGEQSEACVDLERCSSAQSCTDLLVDDEVGKASGLGVRIRTFAIGVPGSGGARSVLSRIAQRGDTAAADCNADAGTCHFDMSDAAGDLAEGLATALEKIVGRALSCELPLPDGVLAADRDRVNVVYSSLDVAPVVIPRDDGEPCEAGANGWQYAADASSIRLCGATCDDARKDPAGRMDVVLGCPVQGPD